MKKISKCTARYSLLALLLVFLVSGCAGTKGSVNVLSGLKADGQAAKYPNLKVDLDCSKDVSLGPSDKERILNVIVKNIPEECPNRFRNVNAPETDPQTLHAVVNITRYDEGNAFARFMVAGLGQMHIGCSNMSNLIIWNFDWTDVAGASNYYLVVYRVGSYFNTIDTYVYGSQFTYSQILTIQESFRYNLRWKVRAWINGSWSDWSPERSFSVEPVNTDCP
jgi:hypothetical protein